MPIKVKDHGKCKEWERRRRDRLNDAFKNLAQLLPHYDPAKIPAKIDILEKSTEFVKELRLSNSRLLSGQAENDEKCKLIKELQDEVNKLILRVKQLTILLKKASITIPTGPELKSLGSKKHKWSGRLRPEDSENSVITKTGAASTPPVISSTSASVPTTSLPVIGTIAATTSTSSSGPPIIIPLKEKETNSNVSATSTITVAANVVTATATISTASLGSGISLTSPQKGATLLTVTSSSSSPTKLITSEPIFTTTSATPIQLPLQTFFLAPCPLSGATTAYTTAPHSQILTRIALPNTLSGMSFQKIPIKSVLKPIPKIIRRRRKRTKTVKELEVAATAKLANTDKEVQTHEKATEAEQASSPEKNTFVPKEAEGESVGLCEPASSPIAKNISEGKDKESAAKLTTATEKETTTIDSSHPANEKERVELIDITGDVANDVAAKTAPETDGDSSVEQAKDKGLTDAEMDKSLENTDEGTEMESSDNIPVLRIIEADTALEDNVMDKQTSILSCVVDSAKVVENTAKAVPEDQSEVASLPNIIQIAEKDKEAKAPEISNTLQSESIKEQRKQSEVTLASNEDNRVVLVDLTEEKAQNLNPDRTELVEALRIETVTSSVEKDANEKGLESEQTSTLRKLNEDTCPTEKLVDREKGIEGEPGIMEGETENTQQKLQLSKESSTGPSHNVQDKKPEDNMPVPELTTNKNVSEVAPVSHETEAVPNLTESEPVPVLPAMMPAPVVTAATSSFSKEKEQDSATSGTSKVLSNLHHELMDTNDSVTTTDKISECIARSIDLIDANDSELMELGEHWEDATGGSPKSPISSTQMFLSMFPLLPRESTVNDHHSQPQTSTSHQHQQQQSTPSQKATPIVPFTPSSSNRSSFFIDAMLPEDHSSSNTGIVEEMGIASSSHLTSCLALTPPQYSSSSGQQVSSPFSLSSNYYWTPATASCSMDNSFDFRPAPTLPVPTPTQRNSTSNSSVASTSTSATHTTPSVSRSFLTFSPIATSSVTSQFSTISSIATTSVVTSSSTTPTKNAAHGGKSGKSSKSPAASKHTSSSDTSFHPVSTKSSKATAVSSTATATNTSVTWTVSAPTQTASSYSHHHHHQQASSSYGPVQLAQNSSTSNSEMQQSTQFGSGNIPPSAATCSLLDSLNPMDASFFRPLINALDAHDFRSLDFSSGNTFPPPPGPPLAPLIPPVPTKPLYTSQFHGTSTNSPSGISVTYHTPTVSSHEQHLPTLISNPPLHSATIFESNLQQHPSTGNSSSSPKKHQNTSSHVSSAQQPPVPVPTSSKQRGNNTNAEKTSRTSGRLKSESSRQSKSGKSSRTQPYFIPIPSSSQAARREEQQNLPEVSTHPSKSQSSTNFLIGQNQPTPSSKSSSSQVKHFDFHPTKTPTNSSFLSQIQYSTGPSATQPPPQQQAPQVVQRQPAKSSISEAKTQKNKEEKSNASSSKAVSKSFHQSHHQPPSSVTSVPTVHSAASLSQPPQRMPPPASSNQTIPKPVNQVPSKSTQAQDHRSSTSVTTHPFQFHTEPFPLFPEFGGGSGSRQFGAHSHHHQPHYHPDPVQEVHSQQQDHAAHNSYSSQRPHPYYLPEISSFEAFAAPIQQHQPQLVEVAHQQSQSHNPDINISRQGSSNTACSQNQNNGKYNNYSSNVQIATNQPLVSTSDASRHRNQNQLHSQTQSASAQIHHQQHPLQHHPSTPQDGHSQAYSQQQHRGHLAQIPSAPQPPPPHHQTNMGHTQQRHPHEPSRQHHAHTQHRSQPPTSIATSLPSSVPPATTSKPKQGQQSTLTQPFNQSAQPQPNQSNQNQLAHPLHQQQQQLCPQQQNPHQQQQQQQQPNRSQSRTVNWMTDTAYRTSSNPTTNAASAKHRQANAGPTNNPFSVSKLVGGPGPSSGQSKPPQLQQVSNVDQQQHPRSNSNPRGKSATVTNSGNSANPPSNSNPKTQHNQSNYCAEALIRKNPNPPPTGDWNDFSFGAHPTFQGYSTHNPHHQHQHPTSEHSSHQNPGTVEHFPNYGQPQYQPNTSSHSSSVTSHFTHFDYSQSQQFHPPHNQNPNQNQHQQAGYHSVPSSTQQHHTLHAQHVHNPQPQPHPTHHQSSQVQYPNQGQHHHPQSHVSSSTSSVTNFNLSTIFPEINDKRSGTGSGNNVGHGSGGGTSGASSARSGGVGSSCNYQHPGFGNQTGSGRNLHQ